MNKPSDKAMSVAETIMNRVVFGMPYTNETIALHIDTALAEARLEGAKTVHFMCVQAAIDEKEHQLHAKSKDGIIAANSIYGRLIALGPQQVISESMK